MYTDTYAGSTVVFVAREGFSFGQGVFRVEATCDPDGEGWLGTPEEPEGKILHYTISFK